MQHNFWNLDFPGHGLSDHKSFDSPHVMSDYLFYVKTMVDVVIERTGVERVTLIGHSMGSGVGEAKRGASNASRKSREIVLAFKTYPFCYQRNHFHPLPNPFSRREPFYDSLRSSQLQRLHHVIRTLLRTW